MFLKFNQKINTIFLDTHSENFEINDTVNIVLSPSLYWVKKVSLPLKYVREVKPLVPSLFEEILPDGRYSYFLYKKEDYFYIFAYEDKVIIDTLKEKGINATQVNKVYFAQGEFQNIGRPMRIDTNQSILIKDDLVILLPSFLGKTEEVLDVSTLALSKNSINLNQFGHIVNNKSLYSLMGILTLLIFIVSIEYFIVQAKIQDLGSLREELFTQNSMKSTMFENQSILKEYTLLHERQMKFRRYSAYLLSLNLGSMQKMYSLTLKGNKLVVDFIGIPKGAEGNILQVLKLHNIPFSSAFKAKRLQIEIEL